MISYSCTVVFIHATRYRLAYHVPQAQQVESSMGQNGKAWLSQHDLLSAKHWPWKWQKPEETPHES